MPPDPEPPEIVSPPLPVEAAVAIDQAAAHAAAEHGHHGPFHSHCENCGAKLEGPYCYKCGQHDFEFHRSFWHVFLESLESFFHFDSKLFQTVVTLLFRPGRLTKEFNAGKRAAQMPPLRMYIFVSLVFFFLFFLGTKVTDPLSGHQISPPATPAEREAREKIRQAWTQAGSEFAKDPDGQRALEAIRVAAKKSEVAAQELAPASAPPAEPSPTSAPAEVIADPTDPKPQPSSELARWLQAQGERLVDSAYRRQLVDNFLHAVPKMLLFCLPLFALYTRVLFRRSGLVYLQHLVLALHFHTLIFLWSMLKDGWMFLTNFVSPALASWVDGIFWIWLLLYPFLMLRELFGNSWPKTVVKTGLLFSTYFLTFALVASTVAFALFALA